MGKSTANGASQAPAFDYNNRGWPRDFDIRIEVAEQQEILQDPQWRRVVKPGRRPGLRPEARLRRRGR